MKIINLTGNPIVFYKEDGETVTMEVSDKTLKPANIIDNVGNFQGIAMVNHYLATNTLPDQKPDTLYLVDEDTRRSIPPERKDFLTMSDPVKEENKIIGYRKLCTVLHKR